MKKTKKQTETEKFVGNVLKGKNSKALKQLESILKKKIARRISSVLDN